MYAPGHLDTSSFCQGLVSPSRDRWREGSISLDPWLSRSWERRKRRRMKEDGRWEGRERETGQKGQEPGRVKILETYVSRLPEREREIEREGKCALSCGRFFFVEPWPITIAIVLRLTSSPWMLVEIIGALQLSRNRFKDERRKGSVDMRAFD